MSGMRIYGPPLATAAVGVLFVTICGGTLLLDHLYEASAERVVATVTGSGRVHGSSGTTRYVRYAFALPVGDSYEGTTSGYTGVPGETILVSYLPFAPSFNRVAGAGQRRAPWMPWATGVSLIVVVAGLHWFVAMKRRESLKLRLAAAGRRVMGTVTRLDRHGRVAWYRFTTEGSAEMVGRTLGLPAAIFEGLAVNKAVEVVFDHANPADSVLAGEINGTSTQCGG